MIGRETRWIIQRILDGSIAPLPTTHKPPLVGGGLIERNERGLGFGVVVQGSYGFRVVSLRQGLGLKSESSVVFSFSLNVKHGRELLSFAL